MTTGYADSPSLALYLHWPFCRAKCPYCDFNSHVRSGVDEGRWRRALLAELARHAAETPGRRLGSIFIGGGTPSLMPPATVAAVIAAALDHWPPAGPVEITLEANPTSVEAGRLRDFRAAGVDRVSLGVQALEPAALRFLGREHGVAEAQAALELALATFPRVSFDLIYARPGQSVVAWRAELARALALGAGHLSLYQLTIEPGTRFHTLHAAGRLTVPDDETQALLWEATQELTEAAGLTAYEVSNHARPGEPCRHNLAYWRSGEWLGIGPGAHGRLELGGQRLATEAIRLPEAWLRAVERGGSGERARTPLSPADQLTELLLMGLRLAEGVPLDRLERLRAEAPPGTLDLAALDRFRAAGLLVRAAGRLAATPAGRQRLSTLLGRLLA
jgi:putative oxygen-independent coproporphyrinogen III oxidase